MKITGDLKIKDVLAFDEAKMLETLMWLAPEFERLRYPKLRRAMGGRVSVAQAARIAKIPLAEVLYVLNIALGEDEATVSHELSLSCTDDLQYSATNPPVKPQQIANVEDQDANVVFVDLMLQADEKRDPMPAIAKGLVRLKGPDNILLLRHPFDPIPLRDMFARKGFESWAEERERAEWFIYFYRPAANAAASAHLPVNNELYLRAFASAA